MLYKFWNCPIKSYIFSKCPIDPIFSTKTANFVNSYIVNIVNIVNILSIFKHLQGLVNKNNMKYIITYKDLPKLGI